MNEAAFSPQTLAFLQQFGADLPSAIAAAPDAALQQVSQGYREARAQMDERQAKALMLGRPANDGAQRPVSARASMLEQMLAIATDPGLRELLENELQTERLVQEHLRLMQMADAAGDDDLADEIGARLRALMDMADEDPDGDLMAQMVSLPEDPAIAQEVPPAPNAEPLGADPVAESQATASEAGDAGVAPGQDGAEPPLSPAAAAVEAAGAMAATSPQNDRPEPTEPQRDAGNYAKGHLRLHGLDISIENPRGTRRRPEWPELTAAYGYIRGSKGKDGEQIDVFIGPDPDSNLAFVVDQVSPESGRFDEHKVILGTKNEDEARDLYLSNYPPDWQGLGAISPMSLKELKAWLKTEPQKPVGKLPKADPAALAGKLKAAWNVE